MMLDIALAKGAADDLIISDKESSYFSSEGSVVEKDGVKNVFFRKSEIASTLVRQASDPFMNLITNKSLMFV
jgi:hypothetical protein